MVIQTIIILSLLLNAGLLIGVVGFVPFFLYLSLIINIGLIWYVYQLSSHTNEFHEDLTSMFSSMIELENHIGKVYELEMFYGDETLSGLLEHTKEIADNISLYNEKYNLDPEYEEELENEIFEEEINAPEEEREE